MGKARKSAASECDAMKRKPRCPKCGGIYCWLALVSHLWDLEE